MSFHKEFDSCNETSGLAPEIKRVVVNIRNVDGTRTNSVRLVFICKGKQPRIFALNPSNTVKQRESNFLSSNIRHPGRNLFV